MGKRHKYTAEFKKNAVRLVEQGEESMVQVARDLGINENTLSGWVQQYRRKPDETFPGSGRLSPEDERLRKLERENRELKEEIEILKKAAAYFAKNQR